MLVKACWSGENKKKQWCEIQSLWCDCANKFGKRFFKSPFLLDDTEICLSEFVINVSTKY